MLNPEIIKKDGAYDTEEGCLSLLIRHFGDSCKYASENSVTLWKVFTDRCRKAGVMTSPDKILPICGSIP